MKIDIHPDAVVIDGVVYSDLTATGITTERAGMNGALRVTSLTLALGDADVAMTSTLLLEQPDQHRDAEA